jgi:hypothetical protein
LEEHNEHDADDIEERTDRRADSKEKDLKISNPREKREETEKIDDTCCA